MKNYKVLNFKKDDIELEYLKSAIDDTAWFSMNDICLLYKRDKSGISRHIKTVLENALPTVAKCATIERVCKDGKTRKITHYNLDLVLKIGERLNSNNGLALRDCLYSKNDLLNNDIIIYNNGNVNLSVNISPKEETVWLTVAQISQLFETSSENVYMHIKNIYDEEFQNDPVAKDFLVTQKEMHVLAGDGKLYLTKFYNLDIVLSVGYRVKSTKAIRFRKWANSVLNKYLLKGYVINEERVQVNEENYSHLKEEVSKIKNDIIEIKEKVLIKEVKEKLFYDGDYFDAYEFIISLISRAQTSVFIN